MELLDPGAVQPLARWINWSRRTLCKASIETEIHWDQGHPAITGNEEADGQMNQAREGPRSGTV